jgi:multiple antibiotic resistance protein
MNDATNSFLLIYAGLFPIVNPFGTAPIFLAMTRHSSDRERHMLAGKVALNGFFLLLGSLFVGSHVLEFFGITLPVVRIAGGLVVTSFGWNLLNAGDDAVEERDTKPAGTPRTGQAFYPLTMPLTVGPGSISVAITLTIFLAYRFAERTAATLGENGTNVLVRLSAFILLCIGIEIIWSGASVLLGLPGGG